MGSLTLKDYYAMLAKQAGINEAQAKEEEERHRSFLSGTQWNSLKEAKAGSTLRIRLPADYITSDDLLTRLDISTNTRVPVTQEWVDEAVAEIVRLNIEVEARTKVLGQKMFELGALKHAGLLVEERAPEVDRIWDAVVAASSR
jgi:hypothetical protein